jgi:hypothetical protein
MTCGYLETSVRLRDKQEQGKKRKHKEAMTKAEDLCATLKTQMKGLNEREGQLRYQRRKARRRPDCGRQRGSDHFAMGCGA